MSSRTPGSQSSHWAWKAAPFLASGWTLTAMTSSPRDSVACRARSVGLLMPPTGTITRLLDGSGRCGSRPRSEFESYCPVVILDPGEQQHQGRHDEGHHPGTGRELGNDEDNGGDRGQERTDAVER